MLSLMPSPFYLFYFFAFSSCQTMKTKAVRFALAESRFLLQSLLALKRGFVFSWEGLLLAVTSDVGCTESKANSVYKYSKGQPAAFCGLHNSNADE